MGYGQVTMVATTVLALGLGSLAARATELAPLFGLPTLAIPANVKCSQERTDRSDIIAVCFGGHDLAIPFNYFDPILPPDLRDEPDDLFLQAYLPGFTPAPTRAPSDSGYGERIYINLQKRLVPLNALFAAAAADRIKTEPFRSAYGLRSFRAEVVHQTTPPHSREIYFAQRDQVVTVFIECEPGYPFPPCHHAFHADGLQYRLTYKIQYLSDWERIQKGVLDVVHGFEHREK